MNNEIEKLHEAASKLSSKDLIIGLATMYLKNESLNEKAILLFKTYLHRALQREGIIL